MTTKILRLALIGAGQRGFEVFGKYGLNHPQQYKFTAVCDTDPEKLKRFSRYHHIPAQYQFTDYRALLNMNSVFDAVIIATMDQAHLEPALLCIKKKYPLFLEKPIAHTLADSIRIVEAAEKENVILQVAHPL
ncbi:MAG TPA: Gfo/Idh/MocA family oxidoreductase, partial [Spirochaetota bacterium]|nr:Gfo/Idh/MocA family oxidoreductase [Spirochaetota bacterium]